ncbi:MAG: molybdopterin cofactor-binding domain-containing protein [Planktotalea sp.]|uniref:xanthine dehydrogenase family protein molybdopterin-binding subunit n=1 Tax=Planktotalea sp. TaxID=2029877 RepID=UPI003C7699E1
MTSFKKIARRTFLIGSAAIVGGVAFGAYKFTRPLENPLSAGPNEAALNPFIFIDQEGVTIITPRAEMGQGVHTTLAALAAEELDIAWEDVRVLHGPPAQAYYNSALMQSALPYPEYSKSAFMQSLSEAVGEVNKLLGMQLTGGSTSMMDGYERLRHAGASAREALKLAAADALQVSASSLRTENGRIIAPDGNSVSYSDMASLAAQIDPPQVELRPKSQWRYLGKTMPRVDMKGKVTGTAEFGIDVRREGMKFATLRMNPRLGGPMRSMDASAATAMAGVEKVIELDGGFAVVASNTWLAFQAADAVVADWGDAPYPHEQDGIWQAIEDSFASKPNSTLRNDGDADTLPEGANEISAEYRVPFLAHATMEPMNATAIYSGDALEIWCGNQGPTIMRDRCAEAVGLDSENVTLHTTLMGGGFGRRGESDFGVYASRVAKAMQGTPVQLTWTREEDMSHDFFRPATIGRYKGAVKDGKAVLLDAAVAGPSVTIGAMKRLTGFTAAGPDKVHVEGAFDQPYAIPNYRVKGHLSDLQMPIGFWRSVGNSVNAFMHDSFLDELAHAAGADPLTFRLEMMRSEHGPSAKVLETVAEMSGWSGKREPGIGRGVAFAYSFGTPVAQVIEVLDEDGTIRINRAWIAADLGTALDPGNLEAQLYGGMIYGLSAACFGEITFANGSVEQANFPDYDALRIHNAPVTEVRILENNAHLGGGGEPGTPPSMSALANALFDLTGKRARTLPLMHEFDLLT